MKELRVDFCRKSSLFAGLFSVSILIPFLHPHLISPVEGERGRGIFPPLMGGEVISSFFILHSLSFLYPHLISPVEGER